MHVSRFTTLAELTPHADDWDRLAAGIPFRGWTWLSRWWRHYGPQEEEADAWPRLAVLGVFDDGGTLVGLAPWYLDNAPFQGHVLCALGSGKVCSEYLGVLARPGLEETIVDVMADYLVENAVSGRADALRWDLLKLDAIDADDRVTPALIERLAALRCPVHRRPGMCCWRIALPTDWEAYLGTLGRSCRRDVRRLKREWLDTGRAVLHEARRLDELPAAMDILLDLHARRRKTMGDDGCFVAPQFLEFYREVVPELLRHGQLEFFWLTIGEGEREKPVAAEFHLVGGGVLYAYQSGVDPDELDCRPGKLIYMAILQQAIAGGYRAFDFLRGDEEYKSRFGARPRPIFEYRIAAPRARARLRHNLWVAGTNVRQWVKKGVRGGETSPGEKNREECECKTTSSDDDA